MKIGLYFGSFNPIHIGHLIIANHLQQYADIDEVWFVVTPQSPFKKKQTLANDYERLHMVKLAIEDYPYLRSTDVEFHLPQPNYTVNTLAKLAEDFPDYEFALLMGEDNLESLHKWKNADYLTKNFDIYVYPRIFESKQEAVVAGTNIHRVNAPIIEISSTFIRQAIQENKNYKPLLPREVYDYIDGSNLFQK